MKGLVLDSISRQPIARALVDANSDAVLTDNEGHFELNLPAGPAQLRLRRPGYGARGRGISHSIKVGANMPDLVFTLTPEAMISGRVTLSTGDEADGIRIVAYRRRVLNGREAWTMQGSVTTNSEGVFRLANLEAPASYLLYSMPVHERVGAIAPGKVSYGYPSLYYPGAFDLAGADVIALSPGQQAQADFTLTRQPFYPVSISMPERPQGRGGGLQIHDASGRTLESSTRWNAQQDAAETNLPNGHYYAEVRGGGEAQMYGRVDFTVAGAPVSGLSLTPVPLHAVPVTVRKEFSAAGGSVSGVSFPASGSMPDLNPGMNLTLVSADAFEPMTGNGGLRRMDGSSDASLFALENVVPGRYWVETFPFDGYVSSITSGGVDLAREPLVIGAGNATAPIEITLRNDFGTIKGQINQPSNAAASAGLGETTTVDIYAIPLFATSSRIPQSSTQVGGEFTMTNLAPGAYHVIALNQTQEINPNDPNDVARFTGKGQTVTVEANGTANAQLDVIYTSDEASAP